MSITTNHCGVLVNACTGPHWSIPVQTTSSVSDIPILMHWRQHQRWRRCWCSGSVRPGLNRDIQVKERHLVCDSPAPDDGYALVMSAGVDPGFPIGGGTNPLGGGGRQHMILPNFAKNCMKFRKFWAVGGGAPKSATGLWTISSNRDVPLHNKHSHAILVSQ